MQYYSCPHKLYQISALGLFLLVMSVTVYAQDSQPISMTSALSNQAESVFFQQNSIGWGIGYIATDAGSINSGFAPTGVQFSTLYARKFTPSFALEGSVHLMNSSFVLDIFSNNTPDSSFYGSLTRILSHSLTGTINGVFSPFPNHTALSPLSFGAGVSLRWSGRTMSMTEINTVNQSYKVTASIFAHSIAIGGHLFIGYAIPFSHNTELTVRAFTDIFLPRWYIIERNVPAQYAVGLQALPIHLFSPNSLYGNGGTVGLQAMFRVHF